VGLLLGAASPFGNKPRRMMGPAMRRIERTRTPTRTGEKTGDMSRGPSKPNDLNRTRAENRNRRTPESDSSDGKRKICTLF